MHYAWPEILELTQKCLHMPLSAATIEPDAACFANRKLFKPEGVGVLGCGREGRIERVSKSDGGCPRCLLSTPRHESATDEH